MAAEKIWVNYELNERFTLITKIKFSNFDIVTILVAPWVRSIIIVVFCIFIILMEFVNETGIATYKKIDKNLLKICSILTFYVFWVVARWYTIRSTVRHKSIIQSIKIDIFW